MAETPNKPPSAGHHLHAPRKSVQCAAIHPPAAWTLRTWLPLPNPRQAPLSVRYQPPVPSLWRCPGMSGTRVSFTLPLTAPPIFLFGVALCNVLKPKWA